MNHIINFKYMINAHNNVEAPNIAAYVDALIRDF